MNLLSKIFAYSVVGTFTLVGSVQAEYHHNHEHHHEEYTEHKAHEHGTANMQLVMMENQVLIEVVSPLFNMLGFEHLANNKQQQKIIAKQLKLIEQAELIALDSKAECSLESKIVQHPFAKSHDSHGHHEHNNHDESKHRDITFEYHFHCKQPANLKQVNTDKLFKAWPNLHKLRVEWIYHNHQSAIDLAPTTPLLNFE